MYALPNAREDGLAAATGRPKGQQVMIAILIGLATLLLTYHVIIAIILLAIVMAIMSWLASNQFGGITGDVLGAAQQLCATGLLVLFAL